MERVATRRGRRRTSNQIFGPRPGPNQIPIAHHMIRLRSPCRTLAANQRTLLFSGVPSRLWVRWSTAFSTLICSTLFYCRVFSCILGFILVCDAKYPSVAATKTSDCQSLTHLKLEKRKSIEPIGNMERMNGFAGENIAKAAL